MHFLFYLTLRKVHINYYNYNDKCYQAYTSHWEAFLGLRTDLKFIHLFLKRSVYLLHTSILRVFTAFLVELRRSKEDMTAYGLLIIIIKNWLSNVIINNYDTCDLSVADKRN